MGRGRVLVTGGTGLLGSNIVFQLNGKGFDVKVLARKDSSLHAWEGCSYELVRGDVTVKEDLENALKDCDYVVHAAAKTALDGNDFASFYKVNVEATIMLIELAQKHALKRFVYVSTANCFTNGTLENPGPEESGFMPWLKESAYAYTKYMAQERVLLAAKNKNLPAVVVAPTFLTGPRDVKPSSGKILLYALKNKVIFYPKGGKSFVDVEYAAQAIVNALEHGRPGECYLIAGDNKSYKEFFKVVSGITNTKKLLIPLPSVMLDVVAYALTVVEKVLGIKVAFNTVNKRLLTLDNYFSNKKAKKELGLKDTDLEYAIKKAIDWFEQQGKINKPGKL